MSVVMGSEYEYARNLVLFGFICGLTFAMLVVTLVHAYTDKTKEGDRV